MFYELESSARLTSDLLVLVWSCPFCILYIGLGFISDGVYYFVVCSLWYQQFLGSGCLAGLSVRLWSVVLLEGLRFRLRLLCIYFAKSCR